MKKHSILIIVLILLFTALLVSCSSDEPLEASQTQVLITDNTQAQHVEPNPEYYSADSLNPDSLKYLGAFLLPSDGDSEQEMFSYGGEALCYNPQNNSLFIAGHNWYTYIAEITIPDPVASQDVSQMSQSDIIQDFSDIKGNLFDKWTMEIPRVGIEAVDDNLFFCFGEHYEEDTTLGTHGYTSLELEESSKVCIAGDFLYATNDYMFSIPDDYIQTFGSNDLLTGRFRDGGWSGMGPSLFAISTENIINAKNNELIPATAVIKYEDSFDGDDGYRMDNYSHADSWTGGAFVSCDAGDAILFAGTHSYGGTWYGFSNGVVFPTGGDENAVYPDVPDYPHDERGWWSDDFRACIMLYSVDDAVKVVTGEIYAYEMQPYAFIDLSEYMIAEKDETVMQYLGGAAYDVENNRLYILELFADGDRSVVHVFTFEE